MSGATPLFVMALVLGVAYVLMIRPQRRRQQDHRALVKSAGVGDDVLTNGGIYGTIVRVEGDDVEVEIAHGVTVHMTRQGITAVLPPEGEEADEADEPDDAEAEYDDEPDLDEVAVTADQEAVTTDADGDGTAADRR